MAVNWENLFVALEKGSSAYDKIAYNSNIYSSFEEEAFNGSPVSEIEEAIESYTSNKGNVFFIGFSRWGGKDIVG
jgi:hypothetical protein